MDRAIAFHNAAAAEGRPGVKWLKHFIDDQGSRLRGQVVDAQFERVRNALLVPSKGRGGLSSLYMANNWQEYYQAMSWDFVEAIKCFAKSDDTSKFIVYYQS